MNLFILDERPDRAAQYHCDKHVVKMIVETAQILSTVHDRYGEWSSHLYKPCFRHHPCTRWAGDTTGNYYWAWNLFGCLLDQYEHRYEKIHRSYRLLLPLSLPPSSMSDEALTPFALAMPDHYKSEDPVESYRSYYIGDKKFAKWKLGNTPEWFKT